MPTIQEQAVRCMTASDTLSYFGASDNLWGSRCKAMISAQLSARLASSIRTDPYGELQISEIPYLEYQ